MYEYPSRDAFNALLDVASDRLFGVLDVMAQWTIDAEIAAMRERDEDDD